VDILVSNAGIQIVAPIEDFKLADWKKLIAVHLDGGFLTSRGGAADDRLGRAAASSSWARCTQGGVQAQEPYVAAKHGLEGLAKVIAKERGAQHPRNVICPGFVRTPLVKSRS
jgi:3-hydroxybutyrate dehydrogenase